MVSAKPKIAFVVSSQLFVRNYFRTDALSRLEAECDVTFLVSDTLTDMDPIQQPGRKVVVYQSDLRNRARQYDTYKVLIQRYRYRSSTFQFRLDRMFEPKRTLRRPLTSHLLHNLNALRERVGIVYRRTRLRLLATSPIYDLIKRRRIDRLEPARGIARALGEADPDLVVMPSSAFNPEGNDVIRQSERMGRPTLFLIDNWDNLSSKSVMLLRPDHLGVWGEQSAEHAMRIQDFAPSEVTLLGTPRFDRYFELRGTDLAPPFDFPYILFLGTSLAFDEASALEHLEGVLNRHPERFEGLRIVYRPHPWRESRDTIAGRGLTRVTVDPQVAEQYLGKPRGLAFQPDLDYYPGLLKNAEIVLGGLTSMLIEATIFGKDYVALTYDDGINITNQRTVLERSEHFRGLERIPSVAFCKTREDVEWLLLAAWDNRGARKLSEIDAGRRFILHDDERPYAERLADLIRTRLVAASR
ncbi:MAG: hypothetical protein HLUCCO18_09585 [Rhodobacteraceae bacterium HLUCCO18]|nr:MAG: hypothetical protein HLUCCO18_09585 [Rhodobacteraceae bacterium HLUCCO18]